MIVNLTFDVEEFDFPLERGRNIDFATQMNVSTEGLSALLEVLQKHHVKATFYVTANYANHQKTRIQQLHKAGHEIASHDYYHTIHDQPMPSESKAALEELIGAEICGYRSPRLAKISNELLYDVGYRYNSSMNPTWIPFRYNNLLKPRTVFTEHKLIQYPTSVSYPFRIPLFWLCFHVLPLWIFKLLAHSALKKDRHLNLYFHPWEFSSQLARKEFNVPRYIYHCSGADLLRKLDLLIQSLLDKGCTFQTTKKYLGFDE